MGYVNKNSYINLINLYEIDNIITTRLKNNIDLYEKLKYRIDIYEKLDKNNFKGKIQKSIEEDINRIKKFGEAHSILILYNRLTCPIVKEYIKIMNTPITFDKRKEMYNIKIFLIEDYLETLSSCLNNDLLKEIYSETYLSDSNNKINNINDDNDSCCKCGNSENFIKDITGILVCKNCYTQLIKLSFSKNKSYTSSVKKCNYDRINHFKDCIKRYQGKQNTFINPSVYTDIKKALESQGLLQDSSDVKTQFSKVKKSHIRYFLKELEYSKYYDDYILIYCNLTEQYPPDISHIENILISEFEEISKIYAKMYKNNDRKNFINIQFILYKLLMKHNCTIDEEDFVNTRSSDRNIEGEKICKFIFKELNWE